MQYMAHPALPGGESRARRAKQRPAHLARVAAIVLIALPGAARAQPSSPSGSQPRPDKVGLPTPINQPPDANARMEEHEHPAPDTDFKGANEERRKQIVDDSSRLLKLAAELKAEVERTGKDMLSLDVIRKADDIERLAHGVKQKMKLIAAAD